MVSVLFKRRGTLNFLFYEEENRGGLGRVWLVIEVDKGVILGSLHYTFDHS